LIVLDSFSLVVLILVFSCGPFAIPAFLLPTIADRFEASSYAPPWTVTSLLVA
jgi:hypothetical protein